MANIVEDLVSIIMLSRNNSKYIAETVKCVQSQTYKNWELVFSDDNSNDDTIKQMMSYLEKDKRIRVSKTVYVKGAGANRASALKDARGRWIAFLDIGDLWEPDKLEKQISFMEAHGYSASYTNYRMIDENGNSKGGVVSGPEVIDWQLIRKCCWIEYLTLMYDANQVKDIQHRYTLEHSDYALVMNICDRVDCYLLNECLAINRIRKKTLKSYPINRRISWRYDTYRITLNKNQFVSLFMTLRNFYYTLVRKHKYM